MPLNDEQQREKLANAVGRFLNFQYELDALQSPKISKESLRKLEKFTSVFTSVKKKEESLAPWQYLQRNRQLISLPNVEFLARTFFVVRREFPRQHIMCKMITGPLNILTAAYKRGIDECMYLLKPSEDSQHRKLSYKFLEDLKKEGFTSQALDLVDGGRTMPTGRWYLTVLILTVFAFGTIYLYYIDRIFAYLGI